MTPISRPGPTSLETNTFNAQAHLHGRLRHGGAGREINVAAARLAREAADACDGEDAGQPRFVAGAIGPTNRTASISPDVNNPGFRNVSFDELVAPMPGRPAASSKAASISSSSRRCSTR